MRRLIVLVFIFSCVICVAQISPPGLGIAKTGSWLALGLRQGLDSANHKQSITYFGIGRVSDPDNYNPYQKSAIIVINEEFYNQFHDHWQYSVALSYRNQRQYSDLAPYNEDVPAAKQEFRIYGRYSYLWKNSRLKFVGTFRQEFRKFYTPDFKDWSETMQFRSRVRAQLTLNIDQEKIHRIIMSAEALFALSRKQQWGAFDYSESRYCLYYSISPTSIPFVFNMGYMNNLIGNKTHSSVHYLALDVIWENPFTRKIRIREKPVEYME